MTVTLDGGTGLMDKLGKLMFLVDTINGDIGDETGSGGWPKELNDVLIEFDAESNDVRAGVDSLLPALTNAQAGVGTIKAAVKTAAQATLIEVVAADVGLSEKTVSASITELIAQMVTASKTVNAAEPTVAVVSSGNTGDGVCIASLLDATGKTMENVLAEDIVATSSSTATSGKEQFAAVGEFPQSDKLAHDWPLGSGASETLTAIDAASTSPSLISGGGFEVYTVANTPDGWTIATGAAGTNVLEEATTTYKGSKAVELVGDASTLISLTQAITSSVASRTPYAVNFWCKVDVGPAAGVLQVDLYDGSSVIDDDAGNACSFTVDLTSIGTTFVAQNAFFRLPEPLPAVVTLRVHLTTALSAGSSLFIDHLALALATQLYDGSGPFTAVFSGATDFSADDVHTITVTNARAGKIQEMFDKFFDMTDLGVMLPSTTGGTENVSDGVIA